MTIDFSSLTIALVGPKAPPAGGMANQTAQLKQLLEASGAKVIFIAVNPDYKPAFIAKLPILRALWRLPQYCISLYRGYAKADIVHLMANSGWSWHLFATPAIWLAKLRRKPILINYRGGHAAKFFQHSWRLVSLSIQQSAGVIVPSSYLQQVFYQYKQASTIVPNVLDPSIFYPTTKPAGAKQLHIIVTRNLEAIYDVACVIRAFSNIVQQFPYAILTIAGSGPERKTLELLVKQLNLISSVKFVGRLNSSEIASLYRSADVMFNSSLVDNSPNSLIEAMASGVPIISSNVGGIPLLVTHEYDALLVAPSQPELFYQQVSRLQKDPVLKQKLITNGLNSSRRFHWPSVSQLLLAQYRQAIEYKGIY
jgi:glycosyltransferase involved in cell wall biosynthesis